MEKNSYSRAEVLAAGDKPPERGLVCHDCAPRFPSLKIFLKGMQHGFVNAYVTTSRLWQSSSCRLSLGARFPGPSAGLTTGESRTRRKDHGLVRTVENRCEHRWRNNVVSVLSPDALSFHRSSIRSLAPSKLATNAGSEPCSTATSSRSESNCLLINSG